MTNKEKVTAAVEQNMVDAYTGKILSIDDILDGGVTAAIHDGVPYSKGGESKSVGNAIVNKKIGKKQLPVISSNTMES